MKYLLAKDVTVLFCLLIFCFVHCNVDESETVSGLFTKGNCDQENENCQTQNVNKKIENGLNDEANSDIKIEMVSGQDHGDVEPPYGHLKKLGEHGSPVIGGITELDYMIGGKDFYEHFIRKREPVVFRNVTHDWSATKYWGNESYLLENYADVLFDVELGKIYNESLNPRQTMDFKEFLAAYKNTTMYLDSPFPQTPLMNDLQLPLMMQCNKLYEAFQSFHLLFSNGGTSSPLHVDGYENFLSVFSGQKVVYAIAPQYIENLYMNENTDFPSLSPINPEKVDLLKFPKFHGTPFHKITLNVGDMLYIPIGWFHQVRSFDSPNIAVSMWFMSFSTADENYNFNYNDMASQEDCFKRLINNLPVTIDCNHQNKPMKSLKQLQAIKHDKKPEKVAAQPVEKMDDVFVNETTLYKEIGTDDGAIIVGSDDTYIYAFDIQTGDVRWKVKTAQDTGSTCAFNNDKTLVYCGADDGYLRAIDVTNGRVVWNFKAQKQIIPSTCVDSNDIIYTASLDEHIYSLHKNGSVRWDRHLKGPIWSSPVLLEEANAIYIATTKENRANTFALDMTTGKTIWKRKSLGGVTSSIRVLSESKEIIVCTHFADVLIYNGIDGDLQKSIALSQTDGITSSPAVDALKRIVYVQLNSGRLVAIAMDTGNILWDIETGRSLTHDANSSPLLFDNTLYVGGGNGTVYAIEKSNGEVIWKTPIGKMIFFSSPRLDKQGVLYIGSGDGPLYALDAKTGNIKWSGKTDGPLVGTARITYNYV